MIPERCLTCIVRSRPVALSHTLSDRFRRVAQHTAHRRGTGVYHGGAANLPWRRDQDVLLIGSTSTAILAFYH